MIRSKTMTKAALAVCALAGTAFAGVSSVVATFDLQDHENGYLAPPTYGLRLDNVIAPGAATFSMDTFNNTTLTVVDNGGNLEINISGTVFGGSVSGNAYSGTPEAFEVEMSYTVGVGNAFGGWRVAGLHSENTGTITRVSDQSSWDLSTKLLGASQTAFFFAPDGYRLDSDDAWVGRGWLMEDTDNPSMDGERDWFFTAIEREIPAPAGAMALLALGGVTCVRRRR